MVLTLQLSKNLALIPTVVMVFLDVSPTECYRRVHMLRCRDVELGIPLEYLAGLGECYHRFVKSMTSKGVLVHSLGRPFFTHHLA